MENYKLIKSFRKTIALQVRNWEIIVKSPFFVTKKTIQTFLEKHQNWITKKLQNTRKSIINPNDLDVYKKQAKEYIPSRVAELATKNWLEYNTIKITSAKTRWWSCTSKKNLNFSFRLILAPKEVIDYVIIHELSHLIHMNHSRRFWWKVTEMMPDYKTHEKWLKENGDLFVY